MSKDLFLMMREEEVATSRFLPTKKEIISSASTLAQKIVHDGEHNIEEVYAQAIRLKEAINAIESELKKALPQDGFESFGIKAQYRNGGAVLNYLEDDVVKDLTDKLEQRKMLLKTAKNSDDDIYDADGVLVPKVSSSERKSSIAITF